MADKSPVAVVKEKFGDKKKLVEAVEKLTGEELWVARTNADKGLSHVSNAKLLRLHRVFSEVKERFGTRAKLIEAILELTKRVKDEGYKGLLSQYPVPRLYDLLRSTEKRVKGSSAPAANADEKKEAGAAKKKAAAPKAKSAPKAKAAKSTAAKS
jgi:hypothetical protein